MQNDFVLDGSLNRTAFRVDLTNSLQSLVSNSSGLTEPTTTYAYQIWYDTTSGLIKERNSANSAWVVKDIINKVYTVDNATNDFRLSVVSGNPNPINSSSGSVYMTPYKGNTIALYDTANQVWDYFITTQIAISVSGLNVGSLYDVFAYNNGVLGVAIQTVEWTNTTTRATALAYKDGVLVKTDNYSRRYLGTFLVSATNVVYDTPNRRELFNISNKLPNNLYLALPLNNTYGSTSKQEFANSTTSRLQIVNGYEDSNITLLYYTGGNNLSTGIAFVGIGQDSTTVVSGNCTPGLINSRATVLTSTTAVIKPSVGLHYYSFIQWCSDTNSTEFIGSQTSMNAIWSS
jgi:hypothetical protein